MDTTISIERRNFYRINKRNNIWELLHCNSKTGDIRLSNLAMKLDKSKIIPFCNSCLTLYYKNNGILCPACSCNQY